MSIFGTGYQVVGTTLKMFSWFSRMLFLLKIIWCLAGKCGCLLVVFYGVKERP